MTMFDTRYAVTGLSWSSKPVLPGEAAQVNVSVDVDNKQNSREEPTK